MVRHVILWKLKEMPDAEKAAVKVGIKEGLEGLAGKIPGLLDVRVYTDALPSSANADLMLDTTFTDAAALLDYIETYKAEPEDVWKEKIFGKYNVEK